MKRNFHQNLSSALLVAACVCAAAIGATAHAQRVPIGTNQIAFSDFDTYVPGSDYGYWYAGPTSVDGGTYGRNRYYYDPEIDPTNGPTMFEYTFDQTVFLSTGPTQPGGWWGTGFGMPVNWTAIDGIETQDPALFTSSDPADYILTFDARVLGLAPGQTTANCDMEFRLGMGGTQWVLVKQLRYHPGTNWTHYRFTLEEGTWISADGTQTSLETFTNAVAAGAITTIAFNQNMPNPSEFGFDGDNFVYLDNIKLEVFTYAGPPPPPPPKVAFAVFDYDFDGKDLWWIWPDGPAGATSGWSANDNKATYWGVRPLVGEGVGGSQALAIAMDNTTILTDPPGKPAWAGGNVAGGGQVDVSQMTSPDLKDYRLNLQARAAGLADDQQTTPLVFQLYFNAPDDTLSPADADTNRDTLLRLNVTINNVKSSWQTFTPSLKDGSVDSGSLANFQAFLNKLDEITFQLQIQNPHDDAVWGLDANNQIIVDNLKLERLATGTPPLKAQPVDGKLVLSWDPPSTGTTKLLSGSTPTTVTTEVIGATSPYTNTISGGPMYFRTQWVAPTQ